MSERYLISPCCGAAIDLLSVETDGAVCPACSKAYEVREDIDFAEFSSSSTEHYRWADDGTHIVRFYFHNMTLDELEGVAERIKALPPSERRPVRLLPIFKAIHDCLKKRIQQHLVFDRVPNLSADQKARIEADLPLPRNHLEKLLDFLSDAYSGNREKVLTFSDDDRIKILRWIRNKEEHIAWAAWPLPSCVHVDMRKLPTDREGRVAELGVPLACDLLNFSIDVLKLIYDLDPSEVGEWHYDQLERHRIHCTS